MAAAPIFPRSKHLQLIPHRIPEADIQRLLGAARLHWQLRLPVEPLAKADRLHAGHGDLGGVGSFKAHNNFAFGYDSAPLNIRWQA